MIGTKEGRELIDWKIAANFSGTANAANTGKKKRTEFPWRHIKLVTLEVTEARTNKRVGFEVQKSIRHLAEETKDDQERRKKTTLAKTRRERWE